MRIAIQSQFISFLDNPFLLGEKAVHYEKNGLVISDEKSGKIIFAGDFEKGRHLILDTDRVVKYSPEYLMIPGLIDCHTHFPQTEIIGAFGSTLLDWLNKYTFIAEQKFESLEYSSSVAKFFLNECLRNGTTSALVFGTVHKNSVNALFTEAKKKKMRLIAGKVLMDRNAPPPLLDINAQVGIDDSLDLIEKWHGVDRMSYAITPRFIPTSTPAQLALTGELWKAVQAKGVYLQTHLSESPGELAWVKELVPEAKNYWDAYERVGLCGRRSVFAHAIHLSDTEWGRIAETNSSIAHCPTSNLFLGSGNFSYKKYLEYGPKVGLATDIGAGTSFSLLKTMGEAYKVAQAGQHPLTSFEALYLATKGAAISLDLDGVIGSIKEGAEADFVILNTTATPLLEFRQKQSSSLDEILFVLMTLGDDRIVHDVYLAGEKTNIF